MVGHLESLKLFMEVADKKSFSAAARVLHMSPPAVTRQIGDLEIALGVQLLVRTTRQVTLTQSGKRYLDEIRPLIHQLARADDMVRSDQVSLSGDLTINAPLSFGQKFLARAASHFRILHQNVRLTLELTDQFIDILNDGADMALRISALPRDKSAIWRKICKIPQVLVASPAYLAQRGTPRSANELSTHICLGYCSGRETVEWRLRAAGQKPAVNSRFALACNNGDVLAEMASLGEGITLLPAFIVENALKSGSLVTLLPQWQAAQLWLTAYYPPYTVLPAKVKAFTTFIEDAIGPSLAGNLEA
jgi:DNA-binding transcriptional LysR family regulator